MSIVLKLTGGARIGWMNATWPFARLTASADQISLSGLLVGSYSFSSNDVVRLEPYGSIPVLGRGVRIEHTNRNYPEKIIFWCFGSPERLISRIHDLGFRPSASPTSVPKRDGNPFRWSFIIAVVVIWNALFILDGFVPWEEPKGPGLYTLLALLLLFLTATTLRASKALQSFALKPGRSASEVRPTVLLVQFISLLLLIGFAAQYLAG